MSQLPNPGTYLARLSGGIVVRMEKSGALMAYIPYLLVGASVAHSDIHALCLGTKDGNLMEGNIDTLKEVFPDWDDKDMYALEAIPVPDTDEAQFKLSDCFHEEYTPEGGEPRITFKAKWFNSLMGGGGIKKMDDDERKKASAAWGARFASRGKTGGGATKAAAKPGTAAAPAKKNEPAAGGPPARSAGGPPSRRAGVGGTKRSSSAAEVWKALKESTPDMSDADRGDKYYAAIDQVAPGVDQDAITPAQWGEVLTALGL